MKKHIILILLFLTIISSCSKYQKVLKSNDLTYKYEQALLYYNNKDFKRALPLFSELHQVMIGTANMQSVSYYFAYCNYATGDNLMAAYLFEQYVKNFPNHKHTEECSYMTAYCYYLETPNYSLDPTNNYKAIKKLQEHINKYPHSKRTKECNTLIDELRNKLSKKAFENAKQYFTTENYKSAIISLNNMLIDFPSFQNREEVYFLIVQARYSLAINSINSKIEERLNSTIDAYNQFKYNYTNSKYFNELEETYKKTKQKIDNLKKIKNEI